MTSGPLDAQRPPNCDAMTVARSLLLTRLCLRREVLGSFYLVEVADEAAARALATAIPASPGLLVTTIPVVPI